MNEGSAFRLCRAEGRGPLVLTCEHASPWIPPRYGTLGLSEAQIVDHIGWDIGASEVAREIAAAFDAPLVESVCSRLVIDCNRDLEAHDLIVTETHGVSVPGNAGLDPEERRRRTERYYTPYHEAVDATVRRHGRAQLLVSVHSFTPVALGRQRELDVGVLYDGHEDLAARLAEGMSALGLRVRLNEPYSGLEGLIHSVQLHGTRNRLPYLEIEVNNARLRSPQNVQRMAARIIPALRAMV